MSGGEREGGREDENIWPRIDRRVSREVGGRRGTASWIFARSRFRKEKEKEKIYRSVGCGGGKGGCGGDIRYIDVYSRCVDGNMFGMRNSLVNSTY